MTAVFLLAGSAAIGDDLKWQDLFDGKSLDGWVQRGGKATYRVEDGAIVGTTVQKTPNSFLCTGKDYTDFILEFDVKVDPKLNSGVQFRSQSLPSYREGRVHGYQLEIDPSDRGWSGGIYDEQRRGWLRDLKGNEAGRRAFKNGEWNHYRLEAIGDQMRTWVNGVPAAVLYDSMTTSGFIALQVHTTTSTEPLEVRWRNLRIQEVDALSPSRPATDPYMGDWEGKMSTGESILAQVIALGKGQYRARLVRGFDKPTPFTAVMEGRESEGKTTFSCEAMTGRIAGEAFTGEKTGQDSWSFEMKRVSHPSRTLGVKAPEGAEALFDGTSLDGWRKLGGGPAGWKVVEGGAMEIVPGSGSIESKKELGDMLLHLEFRTPFLPDERGQHRGNSGVYLQGCYEIQVLDSYGLEAGADDCGSIFGVGKPVVNMCAPPLQWQTYDVKFQAARFDAKGSKTANARVTVFQNGVAIHKDAELPGPTGGAKSSTDPRTPQGIYLQDHGHQLQYRNIWAISLTGMDEEVARRLDRRYVGE
jgi:hypothetical protein